MQQLHVDAQCKSSYSCTTLFKKTKIISKIYILICINFVGQEKMPTRETDSDSGKGTMTSYGSVNSLNTNDGSQTASTPMDNPEQFETQKQQKEIMETGIEMLVMKLYLMKYMFMNCGIFYQNRCELFHAHINTFWKILQYCYFCGGDVWYAYIFQEAFFRTIKNRLRNDSLSISGSACKCSFNLVINISEL